MTHVYYQNHKREGQISYRRLCEGGQKLVIMAGAASFVRGRDIRGSVLFKLDHRPSAVIVKFERCCCREAPLYELYADAMALGGRIWRRRRVQAAIIQL